jgi:hypothetical protein
MTEFSNWRDQILREFTPQVSRLTVVADPDGLLLEEEILAGIRERGFELIPFEDHVAFRFAYESKYRVKWDRGEVTDLVVVLRAPTQDLRSLPYDLLQAGRRLSFSLADLFPNLSYPVLDKLDRADLDAVYRAQLQHKPGKLGDNATKDFLLRHVFEIAPELIKQPVDLLRVLLRRHYRGIRIPKVLDDRLVLVLESDGRFIEWPLAQVVPDREAFFSFLQERWPIFLEGQPVPAAGVIREPGAGYGLKFGGPTELPFDHDDVRVYVDSLFLEGHLRPVQNQHAEKWSKSWAAIGLSLDPQADRARRYGGLLDAIEKSVPVENARHTEWLTFAMRWSELLALRYGDGLAREAKLTQRVSDLDVRVESSFSTWMANRYGGLHNQPATPPVMLHHLPRYLSRRVRDEGIQKIALLVMDGLSLNQWITIRQELIASIIDGQWTIEEGAVFAWVPTVTAVSRQAAFAGKMPLLFGVDLFSNAKEPEHWGRFWSDHDLLPNEVGYLNTLRDGPFTQVEELIAHPKMRVLGLVVDKVDLIMHGMELGAAGMHNQVRQWAREGHLRQLLALLIAAGYEIHLTADHGNIEANGIGRPAEGKMADIRGERVRVYPDDILRRRTKEKFPNSIEWPTLGLPDDYRPLLAANRDAFVPKGDRVVGHGSISIEEVIVPLVRIGKKQS